GGGGRGIAAHGACRREALPQGLGEGEGELRAGLVALHRAGDRPEGAHPAQHAPLLDPARQGGRDIGHRYAAAARRVRSSFPADHRRTGQFRSLSDVRRCHSRTRRAFRPGARPGGLLPLSARLTRRRSPHRKDLPVPGPLHGFRILDLSAAISGPDGTMILADQGADVIKVEPPGQGDFTRSAGNKSGGLSASFLNNNRNKRSITVDLKTAKGVEVVKRLAKTCDVLVQNFRPGVVDRLGLGEEAVRAVAPSIVYVSISGFGERGPFAQKPVYDPIVQALSGLASVQGGSDPAPPRLIRTIVPDKVTAITASEARTAALLARERTGEGQHVRLSMLDAVIAFLWSSDMGGQTYVGRTVSQQRAASFIDLIYETRDGYMSVSVMTDA